MLSGTGFVLGFDFGTGVGEGLGLGGLEPEILVGEAPAWLCCFGDEEV